MVKSSVKENARKGLGTCQYPNCTAKAVYGIFRLSDPNKPWMHCCSAHEKAIAKENAKVYKEMEEE